MLKRIHSIGAHDRPSPVCHAMRSSDEAEVATDAEDSAAYEVEGAGIPGHTCARSLRAAALGLHDVGTDHTCAVACQFPRKGLKEQGTLSTPQRVVLVGT